MIFPFRKITPFIACALAAVLTFGCGGKKSPDSGQTNADSAEINAENANDKNAEAGGDGDDTSEKILSDAEKYPPAPELPPEPDTLRIAVISDINGSYGTVGYAPTVHAAVRDIIRRKADFVLSTGDIVAGQKHGLDYDAMWKAFHYEVGDVFFDNSIEFFTAPGNHDASGYPEYKEEREAYARAFKNRHPRAPLLEGSHFPFYYAVRIRGVLVVALDITRPIGDTDPQLDWLENLLKTETGTRANLVFAHLPITPISHSHVSDVVGTPRLRKILEKNHRTIYISGHHHIYYPGHIGELRTVSVPALGAGPRRLFGAPALPGYVLITIPPQAPPRVMALVAPDFKRMVDIRALPKHILETEREDTGMAEFIIEMLDDRARQPKK